MYSHKVYQYAQNKVVNVCTSCECVDNFGEWNYNQAVNVSLIKSCSFFGHREIEVTKELKQKLKKVLKDKIEKEGFEVFYFGGFGMFDDLCWEIITELKTEFPYIKRVFCLYDQRHLRASKRPRNLSKDNFEEFVYFDLEFDWWYKRIYFRNIAIIDKSDFVVFYVKNKKSSGAYKIYEYAIKKKKSLINISVDKWF